MFHILLFPATPLPPVVVCSKREVSQDEKHGRWNKVTASHLINDIAIVSRRIGNHPACTCLVLFDCCVPKEARVHPSWQLRVRFGFQTNRSVPSWVLCCCRRNVFERWNAAWVAGYLERRIIPPIAWRE